MTFHKLSPEEVIEAVKKSLEFDRRKGIIRLWGRRYALAPLALLVAFQMALEKIMGSGAKAPLYLAGESLVPEGLEAMKEAVQTGELNDWVGEPEPELLVHHFCSLAFALGYGTVEIVLADISRSTMRFTLEDSLIARAYGPSDSPVCHVFAGFMAGVVREMTGTEVHCEEIACSSMGAEKCEFEIAPLESHPNLFPTRAAVQR